MHLFSFRKRFCDFLTTDDDVRTHHAILSVGTIYFEDISIKGGIGGGGWS